MRSLPDDISLLVRTVQGLLIHLEYLHLYDLDASAIQHSSRQTLPVAERIEQILSLDAARLAIPRPLAKRVPVTCRDFALLLCAFLREKSVPARVRCGFAGYLTGSGYEDHWVCEYWKATDRRWHIADAQLDDEQSAYLSFDFDNVDIRPDGPFVSARRAWKGFRAGEFSAARFGHGRVTGPRFLMVNLARDYLALQKCEVSDWDKWRQALPWSGDLGLVTQKVYDDLAAAVLRAETQADVRDSPTDLIGRMPLPFWR